MATVHHWTGLEARALRLALRLSLQIPTSLTKEQQGAARSSKWRTDDRRESPRINGRPPS
jgi:hypothetical protein